MVLTMKDVVGPELLEASFLLRLGSILGYGTMNEHSHPVAYESPYLLQRPLGETATAKGVVDTQAEVLQGIQKRTVQVKDNRFPHFLLFTPNYGLLTMDS